MTITVITTTVVAIVIGTRTTTTSTATTGRGAGSLAMQLLKFWNFGGFDEQPNCIKLPCIVVLALPWLRLGIFHGNFSRFWSLPRSAKAFSFPKVLKGSSCRRCASADCLYICNQCLKDGVSQFFLHESCDLAALLSGKPHSDLRRLVCADFVQRKVGQEKLDHRIVDAAMICKIRFPQKRWVPLRPRSCINVQLWRLLNAF